MLTLRPDVWAHFSAFIKIDPDGRLTFAYSCSATETYADHFHFVPTAAGFWMAQTGYAASVTDLYLAYSATELLCFVSQRPQCLFNAPEQAAFAATGYLPSADQVNALKAYFPNARWHLLFGSDVLGRIIDASIAGWYKGHPANFRVNDDQVNVRFRGKLFLFDVAAFSLNAFERKTGLRAGLRTHKPPKGWQAFLQINLQAHDP